MSASRFVPQLVVGLLAATIAGCGATSTTSIPAPATQHGPAQTGGALATAGPAIAATLPSLAAPSIDLAGVPARLHVEADKGASAWIGPAGGTITTSAADGTTYELTVPALAVADATPISMTPIASIDTLGLSGGLAGAVYLGPTGLKLAEPAILKVTSSKTAPAGMRLVGFDVADDGVRTDLVPASAVGGVVTVSVSHFSTPVVGFGTTQDLALLAPAASGPAPSAGIGGDMATSLTELLALPTPWTLKEGQFAQAYVVILAANLSIMQPELRTAATDAQLLRAISDWRTFVLMLNLTAHDGDSAAAVADGPEFSGVGSSYRSAFFDGQIRLGDLIANAIDGNKQRCEQSHDLHALANMTFWAGIGRRYVPNWGDWAARSRGCADIAIGLFNPATNLTAGGSDSLQVSLLMAFTDGTQVPGDFALTVHGVGFTYASSGTADATAGEVASATLTFDVTAVSDPPYTFAATACWSLDGLARDLCSGQLSRSFGPGSTGAGQGGNQPPPPPPPTNPIGTQVGLYIGQWTTCNTITGNCFTKPGSIRPPVHSVVPDWVFTLSCETSTTGYYQFRVPDLASFTATGVGSPPNQCSAAPTLTGTVVGTTLTLTLTDSSNVVLKFIGTFGPYPS